MNRRGFFGLLTGGVTAALVGTKKASVFDAPAFEWKGYSASYWVPTKDGALASDSDGTWYRYTLIERDTKEGWVVFNKAGDGVVGIAAADVKAGQYAWVKLNGSGHMMCRQPTKLGVISSIT